MWLGGSAHHVAVACEPHCPPAVGWRVVWSAIPLPHQIAARKERRIVDRDVQPRTQSDCVVQAVVPTVRTTITGTNSTDAGVDSDHSKSCKHTNTNAKRASSRPRGWPPTVAGHAVHVRGRSHTAQNRTEILNAVHYELVIGSSRFSITVMTQ